MFEKLSKKTGKVLDHFLDNPGEEFYLRQVATILKISASTAKIALETLEKEGILKKESRANANFYSLNTESKKVTELKIAKNMDFITRSGIAQQIQEQNTSIISLVLFGSYAKGNNTKNSDIDILIISQKKANYSTIDCEGVEVSIIQYTPQEWKEKAKKDKPFYQEIITTGKVLVGTLPVI
ncbi:MAG: nucleotidyltransferase domain-containing protein [Nanoarchaeota archaeon]|nr:nucleotidyltransferase domain-containing protein [Nanoarchaeota archaeon]